MNDNNLSYTRELCQWAIKNGVRFVYASSASTYGDGSMGMDDEDEDIEKYQPLNLMVGLNKTLICMPNSLVG